MRNVCHAFTLKGAPGLATRMLSTNLKTAFRAAGKRTWTVLHDVGARMGLYVLPKHYYVPLPDLRSLRRSRETWARRSDLIGVRVDLDQQLQFLTAHIAPFEPE